MIKITELHPTPWSVDENLGHIRDATGVIVRNYRDNELIKHIVLCVNERAGLVAKVEQLKNVESDYYYKVVGIMHSVDKWLENVEEDAGNEVERAAQAREIALQAIERQEARAEKAEAEKQELISVLKKCLPFDPDTGKCIFCGCYMDAILKDMMHKSNCDFVRLIGGAKHG
jgi:hypothetical protein